LCFGYGAVFESNATQTYDSRENVTSIETRVSFANFLNIGLYSNMTNPQTPGGRAALSPIGTGKSLKLNFSGKTPGKKVNYFIIDSLYLLR
jgi:hypothetical protein